MPHPCLYARRTLGATILLTGIALLVLLMTDTAFSSDVSISVSGNKRTKTRFIKNIVEDYLRRNGIQSGAAVNALHLEELILNKELFSEVDVVVEGEHIHVAVKDRWTLIPIPIVSAESGQDTTYGLFVYESNFLGYGKQVVLGGMLSRSQQTYFAMYQDPELAFSNWQFQVQASRIQDIVHQYRAEEKVLGEDRLAQTLRLGLGYRFAPFLESSLTMKAEDFQYHDLENHATPDDYRALSAEYDVRYDRSKFRFYYKDGLQARLEIESQLLRSDSVEKRWLTALMLQLEKNPIGKQALQIQVMGLYMDQGDERDLVRTGSTRGFRGVPQNGAWVDRGAAAAVDYQIPLWFGDLGTWTVAPFWDVGYLEQGARVSAETTYHALGIGTYIYLKNIALPGIGVHVGTNDAFLQDFFNFTIGFTF